MSPSYSTSRRKRSTPVQRQPHVESAERPPGSGKWGNTAKLLVGLGLFVVTAWLFVRFQNIIGLLMFALVLAYLLHPIAQWFHKWSHFSWRLSVGLVFLVILAVILGLTTLSGLAVVEQSQSLIGFLDRSLENLPQFLEDISATPIKVGPFIFQPDFTDLNSLSEYLLGLVQSLLGQAGSILGTIVSGAASFFSLFAFLFLIAYFILAESGGVANQIIRIGIPGYNEDLATFRKYLGGIWNAFMRGQFTIVMITIVVYMALLGGLGVRFFIGLAVLAGLARFVPYVGPAIVWITYGLVSYFQGSTIFGLSPFGYVLLVVGISWVMDFILDNFVQPRLMSGALQIHPAAVLVSAIVGANLFGLIGVVLAAPVVATIKLLMSYIFNRLFDRDPWYGIQTATPQEPKPITQAIYGMLSKAQKGIRLFFRKFLSHPLFARIKTKE